MTIEEIKQKAKACGGCELIDKVETWQDAADLLFSPQGQEFFQKTGYPDSKAINSIGKEVDGFYNRKSLRLGNPPNLCISGAGYHSLAYDGVPEEVPIIMLLNANAFVKLDNYAIVKIVKYGECEVTFGGDGTGIVL